MSSDDTATNPVNSVGEFQDDLPFNNTVIGGSRKWKELLTHTDARGVKEADVYQCLIHYLKSLLDSGKEDINSINYYLTCLVAIV